MPLRNVRFVLPVLLVSSGVAALAGCGSPPAPDVQDDPASAPAISVHELEEHTVLLDSTDPAELALTVSQTVYERAETVVLADAADESSWPGLAAVAVAARAPALLARGGVADGGLGDELERLGVRSAVVVEGTDAPAGDGADGSADDGAAPGSGQGETSDEGAALQAAEAAGVQVVSVEPETVEGEHGYPALDPRDLDDLAADLEEAGTPVPTGDGREDATADAGLLREVLAVVDPRPGQTAAIASLRAAGAVAVEVPDGDLGAPAAVRTLDEAQALAVVGLGPTFGTPEEFAWRVAAAERAALLPTGTQHLLPGRYVTTAADRWDDPQAAVEQARTAAAAYEDDDAGGEGGPVVPALEVTVGTGTGAGVSDDDVDAVRPLVAAAQDAGAYVLLDLPVAGPEPLVEQVAALDPLLQRPGVGLAVHPEQRLGDGVATTSHEMSAAELQGVVDHLAALVAGEGLPPAMLVVHQTRPESVSEREELRPVPQVEVVLAADRTGGATTGEWVWDHVSADVPDGVHLGWSGLAAPYPGAGETVPEDPAPVLVAAS
ncbi:hypothetical protein [Isoptericola sp. BMS4]|uniref:hypothetical protein n=1 Tax=Isoptericola sp. BMS4 TaxID=2527875 RepID=UPI0014202FE2|nr:hypothetical protein [Isoptericola sp. BMS4]